MTVQPLGRRPVGSAWKAAALGLGIAVASVPVTTIRGQAASAQNLGSCIGAGYIYPGQYLGASGFELLLQDDGNLVAETSAGHPIWDSQTGGNSDFVALQGTDGNLVIYSDSGPALWSAHVPRSPGDRLCMQDDGNVVVYSSGNAALWAAGSAVWPNGRVTSGNGYPTSQCTWLAEQEAHYWTNGLWPKMGGNADTWYADAAANGWSVGTAPRIGSIVVFQPGVDGAGSVGHVAWVTEFYPSSGSITVLERNFEGPGQDDTRTISGPVSPMGNDASKIGYVYMNP